MDDANNAFQQMQDEMSRFEAEISGGGSVMVAPGLRPVIAASTFGAVQQQLGRGVVPPPPPPPALLQPFDQGGMSRMMYPSVPPPPPPPSMMVPPQVSRHRHPIGFPMGLPRGMPGPQLPPPPPRPQPVVLSAAPKLYKHEDKPKQETDEPEAKKPKQEPPPPVVPLPPAAPAPAPAPALVHEPPPPPPHQHNQKPKKEKKNRKVVRTAGGQVWEDVSLLEWPDDDFRMFCGDLGNDVTDELLVRTFGKYPSFQRAKVVRDKRTNKSRGFGFVSFKEPQDFIKAMKEMDGRYVGSRPIKLRKSTWRARSLDVVRKKEKEKQQLLQQMMGGNL